MTTVADKIVDYFPANDDVSIPLGSTIWIEFDGEMNEDFLEETLFVTGPDTDQFVGVDIDLLEYPENVSEGDDFLESPGYTGIVQGTVTFEDTDSGTKWIFTPNNVLAALTEYTVHIPEVKDVGGTTYEGYQTFTFTTGTGSIVELPSSGSTSVIGSSGNLSNEELIVIKTTPADHATQVSVDRKQIVVEFSTTLDPDTVTTDKFTIIAEPSTDHPAAGVTYSEEELIKTLEVEGHKVIISI